MASRLCFVLTKMLQVSLSKRRHGCGLGWELLGMVHLDDTVWRFYVSVIEIRWLLWSSI